MNKEVKYMTKRVGKKRVFLYPELHPYRSMISRCTRPANKKYADYGGRGISVHPDWLGEGGFWKFLEYIGRKPTSKHEIDRINNDGNYEPGNVRWVTRSENMKNTRKSRLVTINGEVKNLTDWCKVYDIPITRIYNRTRLGWDIVDAITTPIGKAGYFGQRRNTG